MVPISQTTLSALQKTRELRTMRPGARCPVPGARCRVPGVPGARGRCGPRGRRASGPAGAGHSRRSRASWLSQKDS